MIKEMPCITCPMSCRLQIEMEADTIIAIRGNTCPRGEVYARKEISHPERMVTTTVKINNAIHPLLPVITSQPVPKEQIFAIMDACRTIQVAAPIAYGEVIISHVCGLDVDILASRSM